MLLRNCQRKWLGRFIRLKGMPVKLSSKQERIKHGKRRGKNDARECRRKISVSYIKAREKEKKIVRVIISDNERKYYCSSEVVETLNNSNSSTVKGGLMSAVDEENKDDDGFLHLIHTDLSRVRT